MSMPAFRSIPLSLALGAALMAPAQAQSLVELLNAARSYDAPWQSAKAQLDASVARADQARAGLLPSAALSSGLSRTHSDISAPPITASMTTQTVGINATQPLYRPANRITLQQGLRGVDVAQAQLDAATQDLLVRVSQGYFDVLAAQDSLTFVQAQKAAVSEQLAAAKRNFGVGTSTITDSRSWPAKTAPSRSRWSPRCHCPHWSRPMSRPGYNKRTTPNRCCAKLPWHWTWRS